MLKRDLPGLSDIVDRLGQQPGIRSVMIVNPQREVRFASDSHVLGRRLTLEQIGCGDCSETPLELPRLASLMTLHGGSEVLRIVNPIKNKPACIGCHGPMDKHPINGVLIVDHEPSGIRKQAFLGAAMLSGAGLIVVFVALFGTWAFLRRAVIAPVAVLDRASRVLASGNLKARATVQEHEQDEIGNLCRSFNEMAEKLGSSLDAIREHDRFLQALIDAMPDGVRVIDEDYRIVMANGAYCEQLGLTRDAVLGLPCYHAHGRTEPCPPTLITCPFHAQRVAEGHLKYVHRHVRGDGSEFYVEIAAAQLEAKRHGERSTLIVESIRDLSRQVKYSQEQRLAELGQLATGVAHEIYNPLASVRLGLQSLLRRVKKGETYGQELPAYLTTVDGEVDKCIEVTKRLLDLSLAPTESPQLVSFSTIIPEVVSLLRYEAQVKRVEIEIELGREDLRVLATDSELRMLILNLVQNAFHAMPEGGRLAIRGCASDGKVRIEVEDSGVGIAPDDIAHIYEPFFSKRADGVQGTGLGLAIAKAIVTRHNGRLDARSALGEGSLFIVTMPLAGDGTALS